MPIFEKFLTKILNIVLDGLRIKLSKCVHVAPASGRQDSVNTDLFLVCS